MEKTKKITKYGAESKKVIFNLAGVKVPIIEKFLKKVKEDFEAEWWFRLSLGASIRLSAKYLASLFHGYGYKLFLDLNLNLETPEIIETIEEISEAGVDMFSVGFIGQETMKEITTKLRKLNKRTMVAVETLFIKNEKELRGIFPEIIIYKALKNCASFANENNFHAIVCHYGLMRYLSGNGNTTKYDKLWKIVSDVTPACCIVESKITKGIITPKMAFEAEASTVIIDFGKFLPKSIFSDDIAYLKTFKKIIEETK